MLFFKRGPGPLVSVFIVTRKRAKSLIQALDSLISLSHNQSSIEFVIKADEDDLDTINIVRNTQTKFPFLNFKLIITPRGKGYAEMHNWLNIMAKEASGDWIFIFNDDARMKSDRWDEILLNVYGQPAWFGMDDVCLLIGKMLPNPTYGFPFLRRKVFDILGHICLSPLGDTWLYTIMVAISAYGSIPILVDHLETKGDDTREESNLIRRGLDQEIRSIEMRRLMMLDSLKLLNHMQKDRDNLVWEDTPQGDGWYWLKRKGSSIIEHAVVDKGTVQIDYPDNTMDNGEGTMIVGKWALRLKH